jgi:hypothetical protein
MPATYNKYKCDIVFPPETTAAPEWEAPSDWIDISSIGSNEVNLLVKEGSGIAFAVTVSGTFSINWGDGTIQTGLTSGTHQHQHTTGGTPCSLGYNTWKIRIYGAASDITAFKITRHSYTLNIQYSPVLSAVLNVPGVSDYSYCFSSSTYDLYCKSMLSCEIKSFRDASTMAYMFNHCNALASVTLPDTWGNVASTATYMFQYCYNLTSVKLPASFGSVTQSTYMFSNCFALASVTGLTSWGNCQNATYMFEKCYKLTTFSLPDSWGSLTNVSYFFYNCYSLASVTLPTSWGSVNTAQAFFYTCNALDGVILPSSWGSITSLNYFFQSCYALSSIVLPSSWGNVNSISGMFQNCFKLTSVNFPASWGSITNTTYLFGQCNGLTTITMPTALGSALANASNTFLSCYNLKTIVNFEFIGSNTVQCNLQGIVKDCDFLQSAISNGSKISEFGLGASNTNKSKITSVRLTNPGSTFLGSFPHVDVSYSDLSIAALNLLFGDLPTVSGGQYIKITGCTGAAGCTRTIATTKGWTVTG